MIIVVTHWRVLKLITGEDFDVAEVKKFGNLLLVRHPETSLNAEGCLRGHIDIGLTERGEDQIEDIMNDILFGLTNTNKPSAIYSSDLKRAAYTAERLTLGLNIPLFLTKDLRPADLGEMTGKPIKDVVHLLQEIDNAGDDGQFPNGESIKEFKTRIHKVFDYLGDK